MLILSIKVKVAIKVKNNKKKKKTTCVNILSLSFIVSEIKQMKGIKDNNDYIIKKIFL